MFSLHTRQSTGGFSGSKAPQRGQVHSCGGTSLHGGKATDTNDDKWHMVLCGGFFKGIVLQGDNGKWIAESVNSELKRKKYFEDEMKV